MISKYSLLEIIEKLEEEIHLTFESNNSFYTLPITEPPNPTEGSIYFDTITWVTKVYIRGTWCVV